MPKSYVISDTHFGHKAINDFYDRPDEDSLIANWNHTVTYKDHVYILGDMFMTTSKKHTEHVLSTLNGRLHLVRGNHDAYTNRGWYQDYFEWIKDYHEMKVGGTRVIMSHYPFMSWRFMNQGSIMLHGHCHGKIDRINQWCRRYDVGVDANGGVARPQLLAKIVDWVKIKYELGIP